MCRLRAATASGSDQGPGNTSGGKRSTDPRPGHLIVAEEENVTDGGGMPGR